VIGDPIAHSRSPRIFEWLFAEAGIPGDYRALHVPARALAQTIAAVRRGDLQGLSVTLPHKQAVLSLLDEVSADARTIGAVNCVARGASGRLCGFNTDASGCQRALEQRGRALRGARMVVLGAGGAGRAAAVAARDAGVEALGIANRTPATARALAAELGDGAQAIDLDSAAVQTALDSSQVLVNATSVGLSAPLDSPLPEGVLLGPELVVMDMVYAPLETALLRQARAAGASCVDGLWMLVHQALEQLRIWTGFVAPPSFAARVHGFVSKEMT
jgi:shikimate dehydrogenase